MDPAGKAVGDYSFDSGVDFSVSWTVYVAVWSALRVVVSYYQPDHAAFSFTFGNHGDICVIIVTATIIALII